MEPATTTTDIFITDRAAGRPNPEVVDTLRKYERLTAKFGKVLGVDQSRVTGPLRHLDVLAGVERRPPL